MSHLKKKCKNMDMRHRKTGKQEGRKGKGMGKI